ncbi:hypothetical protein [Hamadaea tsunoensis]|uniref:hypothetical protein n=1 Tax=Hamadaea tsunoensis TaxID=53368 RepID=UPI0004830B38|nr:hypothetical protein [Hamadaea tsunoensis]
MADGTDEFVRAMTRLVAELIREASRVAIELAERRAERLRLAAQHNERVARAERVRLAAHRAADAAIWRRTADPVWWRKATPEQLARAWRATTTWYQVDPEAAGARRAMADRLRARDVHVDTDVAANPGDARWLQAALDLAMAERDEQAALAADQDSDIAVLVDELMWDLDELPRPATAADPAEDPPAAAPVVEALTADEVLWALDELTADELARRRATSAPATSEATHPSDIVEGEVVAAEDLADPVALGPADPAAHPADVQVALTDDPVAEAASSEAETTPLGVANPATSDQATAGPVAVDAPGPSAAPSTDEGPWPPTAATDGRPAPAGPAPLDASSASADVARMEEVLRSAWPADRANRVLHDPSWPALASTMHGLDRTGKDVSKLLQDLPIDTTDAKLPAILTAWALRAAARGPVSLGRAVHEREHHLQRTEAARQAAERRAAARERDPGDVAVHPAAASDGSVARLLAAAFPTTTKDALNRPTAASGPSEPAHDHASAREPVAAER